MDEHLIGLYGDQKVWFFAMYMPCEGWYHDEQLTYREAKERYDEASADDDKFIGIRVEG